MKACLLNLIIYTDSKKQLPYLNEIGNAMAKKYPARIIVIYSDKDILAPTIKKIPLENTYDQIHIELPPKVLDNISLFVLPFLIPDYHTCLFYSGNPANESPVFNALIRLSNRLIVDSETADNMVKFCDQMEKLQLERIDLNWARTLGWRLTLTSLFDTQEKMDELAAAKTIHFYYQRSAHSLNPAIYLQAWLATTLHWEYGSRDGMEVLYKHKKGICRFALEPTDGTDAIHITTDLDYDCQLLKDSPQVCIHVSSMDACSLPYKLYFPNFERGASYLTQLLYSTTSKQYCDMLPMLKRFYE